MAIGFHKHRHVHMRINRNYRDRQSIIPQAHNHAHYGKVRNMNEPHNHLADRPGPVHHYKDPGMTGPTWDDSYRWPPHPPHTRRRK